jgi:arabinan endo-1,5-alpha-L-arabinosidase
MCIPLVYWVLLSLSTTVSGKKANQKAPVGQLNRRSVTGPYLDKDAKDMMQGGGSLVIKGNKDWPGLGHNAVYSFDNKDYLVLNAYEAADKGIQKLRILPMSWKDAWPVVEPNHLNNHTTILAN